MHFLKRCTLMLLHALVPTAIRLHNKCFLHLLFLSLSSTSSLAIITDYLRLLLTSLFRQLSQVLEECYWESLESWLQNLNIATHRKLVNHLEFVLKQKQCRILHIHLTDRSKLHFFDYECVFGNKKCTSCEETSSPISFQVATIQFERSTFISRSNCGRMLAYIY